MIQTRQNNHDIGTKDSTDLAGLGRFVRTRRHALELTQSRLAERLGWVQERVSLVESGKYELPSLPSLAQLASAVETELGDILVSVGYEGALARSEPGTEGELAANAALCSVLMEWAYLEGVEPVSARIRQSAS